MRIDVHSHYYPKEYLDGIERLQLNRTIARTSPGAGMRLDERVDMLTDAGVDVQVLCVGAEQPYATKREEAVGLARLVNDIYRDVTTQYPTRFAAFGAVPLPHVDGAIDEMGRCIESLGMLGVNIGCFVGGRPIDDPEFEPFFAELDRRSAVLFLHPVGLGVAPLTDAHGMAFMVGGCFEDTSAAIRLAMSGLTARHPHIKVIVPHLGGTLPFLIERIDERMARQTLPWETATASPRSALRKLYFDTVNGSTAALRCACEAFGADHLMLGTDFPFQGGAELKLMIDYVEKAGLSTEDIAAIQSGTAKRVLSLPSA